MTALIEALNGSTPTTTSTPTPEEAAPVTAGVSATDQFKAMERQSGLQSFLSSSVGAAVLQVQTATEGSAVANFAASLVDKAVSEYRSNASAAAGETKAAAKTK
jgi:hypothetical protein